MIEPKISMDLLTPRDNQKEELEGQNKDLKETTVGNVWKLKQSI